MSVTEIIIIAAVAMVVAAAWTQRDRLKQISRGFGSSTSILDSYSRDLTAQAKEGKLDPVINRQSEIARVIQILSRRTKNNPILLGEAGVGKTAIAEGLAQKIASGEIPSSLKDKRVLAINVSGMIAGTKYRGEFESRLKKIMEEIHQARRQIILFIDEVHILMEAKGAEGAMDPSDILKPALARGDLQAIGATTLQDYEKYIKPDESLERRFQPVVVKPPTVKMTIEILEGIAPVYEKHHRVKYTPEALKAAAVLSDKYIKNRYLPDKAIDLIDESGAKIRLKAINIPNRIKKLQEGIARLSEVRQKATSQRKRSVIDKKIATKQKKIAISNINQEKDRSGSKLPTVDAEDIRGILADWIGKPKSKISKTLSVK
ncbi:MAG: ATP-dependent Clp protease ATP-binding subunit [Parcubacteria group bacterium]|nr:ATP-dependent Clp protease ATP-binding subunit [Parcubacteria group bacterium]